MLTAHLCLTSLCCHQIGVEAVRSSTLNKPRKVVSADATQAGIIHSLKSRGNVLKTDSSGKPRVSFGQFKLLIVSDKNIKCTISAANCAASLLSRCCSSSRGTFEVEAPLFTVQLCEHGKPTLEDFVVASRLYAKFGCPVACQKFSLLATAHDCDFNWFGVTERELQTSSQTLWLF